MRRKALVLVILIMCILTPLYKVVPIKAKYVLFPVINVLSLIFYFSFKSIVDKSEMGVKLRTLSRACKFVGIFLLIYTLHPLGFLKEHYNTFMVLCTLLFLVDMVRAFLYESARQGFENKVIAGYFRDVLVLEKYIMCSLDRNAEIDLRKDMTVDEFYAKGRPKPLPIDELFELWNDQNPFSESNSSSELGMDASDGEARTERKRRWRVKVRPETYEFESSREGAINYERPFRVSLSREEERIERSVVIDRSEVESDGDENYSESVSGENFSHSKWFFLEEGKHTVKKVPAKPGLVTVRSLRANLEEAYAVELYRLLSFKRNESINYDVFKDNARQISNERNNLYQNVEDNRRLLDIIWYTLSIIETVVFYIVVARYLEIQPLLLELLLPILILPAFSVIKIMVESFFFIVFSHPYDPGDRVYIDGENMIVRGIQLLSTTFDRWDGVKVVIPNSEIRNKMILNIRRSKSQQWKLEFYISSSTPPKKIELMREAFKRFVKNNKIFITCSINLSEVHDSRHLKLQVIVKHSNNFQSGFLMWTNHSKFVGVFLMILSTLKIKYRQLDQDVISLKDSVKTK
jgi:small-conductance mechanosensitive channel